jgi:3',5'-cyclic AMP phosphodiesterase CpdA
MTRHIEIIHLSDLHFGPDHQFTPQLTPDGSAAAADGNLTLAEVLLQDLLAPENEPLRPTFAVSSPEDGRNWQVPPMRKLICLSGDFATNASKSEFDQAARFVKAMCASHGKGLGLEQNQVFVCPGNHDLDWNSKEANLRWGEYAAFLNAIYPQKFLAENAANFGGVSVCDKSAVLVLSLNSEMFVHNQAKDKTRGDLSPAQLIWAKKELDAIPKDKCRNYIKIAMVHHHPILLPTLAEPNRGYDAINGAQHLLTLLHRYGFHVLLHGHKHYPHTFHENVRNAFEQSEEHSLVVVAGGSCGSTGLPKKPAATQTYNRIRIHWDSTQGSTRVQVVTRGLVTNGEDGHDLMPAEWHWKTLANDDRSSLTGRGSRVISPSSMRYLPSEPKGALEHEPRDLEYRRTRYNFPVAEVRPSLLPTQTNEVQLRIVHHDGPNTPRDPMNEPVAVTWSAGHRFPKVRVERIEDSDFSALFAYYGGALIRAEMAFADGYCADVYIYAPIIPAPGGGSKTANEQ